MGTPVQPTPGPNVELELAKLANDAIAAGHDPGDVTAKLHATIQYLRQFPQVAQQATNALADGKTTPADITRLLAPHVRAMQGAAMPDDTPDDPSYAQRALGGIAALGHDIPGVEAAQAGARALVRGQSYRDALSDIQQAEQSAPKAVRVGNNLIGGGIAAMATPGGPVLQSARYGILHGLLNSNPDENLAQRTNAAALEGGVGAVAGKVGDQLTTVARALASKTPGAQFAARRAAMAAADALNYGKAAEEGTAAAASPMPESVQQAFNEPDIAPYVAEVRNSRTFANADDPTVLREAYKLMSEHQGTLNNRLVNANDFKAGTSLGKSDVGLAKQQMLSAADEVMPSFRQAVEQHAQAMGAQGAMQTGVDAATRMGRGTLAGAKKLGSKSPEALRAALQKMTPEEAQAALAGALGRTRELMGVTPNPLTGFGLGQSLMRAGRVGPFMQAAEQQAGGAPIPAILARALVASQSGPIAGGNP